MTGEQLTRILVVDDEQTLRRAMGRLLRGVADEMAFAGCVEEACQELAVRPVDLVITDVEMPGASGLDLARYLARDFPDVALLIVTGQDSPRVAEAAASCRASGYLVKPFCAGELIGAARAALAGVRGGALTRSGG